MHGKKRDVSRFRAFLCRYGFISTQKEEIRASIRCEPLRPSILDLNLTRAHIHYLFRKIIQWRHLIKHNLTQQYFRSRRRRRLSSIILIIQLPVMLCISVSQSVGCQAGTLQQVAFQLLYKGALPGDWRSGQCAPPGIPKVLGSNPAFSTKHVHYDSTSDAMVMLVNCQHRTEHVYTSYSIPMVEGKASIRFVKGFHGRAASTFCWNIP